MKRGFWLRWLAMLLPVLMALASSGCTQEALKAITGGSVTVSGTVKLTDGKVPVAVLDVFDSNGTKVASTGVTGISSQTGAYSLSLSGSGSYNFVITATDASGKNVSMKTGSKSISGNTTLNFTLGKTVSTSDSTFDIGSGPQSLLAA